jgi:hypothetical protein
LSQNSSRPEQSSPLESYFSFNEEKAELHPIFNPSQFVIPGWKGEGLITASAITIKNILSNLSIDSLALFKKSCQSSKSMKMQTYNEFLHFAQYAQIDCSDLKQFQDFWTHVQDDSSPLKKPIENFLKVHSFRAVAIYLFRIKFIMDLAKEQKIVLGEDVLMNPLSFLGKIFVKNSSTELLCDSLQMNQYSWYRPSQEYKENLTKLKEAFENVTLTELIKLISTPKDDKIYSIRNYSHSISHVSFGLLINDLLIKFPHWIKQENKSIPYSSHKLCILPKTINTKFVGNHVSSLALSHWLAQETNVKLSQWDNLICPDFEGEEFIDGQFLKICQELQFLSFLTRIAAIHKYEIVPFICKIMREKYRNPLDESIGQPSFFNLGELPASETLYHRVVLNLTELPKTNPHHFLVQQILSQKNSLRKDGVIFVFTNQKLFVPSHSERVELLLKDFKVEASFNLEDLKGKGEIAHFAYVLTLRKTPAKADKHLFEIQRKTKESCLSFQFNGNLTRFNKFNKFVVEFQQFIKNKNPINHPIYISEVEPDIHFKFHQDAIMEGKLVSSISNLENGHLPHPSFFKNLTKSSSPLDTFFQIESINHEDLTLAHKKNISSAMLGLNFKVEKQYPLLLIVNQSDPMNVTLELVPIEAYRSKLEKYGTAYNYYFGLIPKHSTINLNVFREYFTSPLGYQIIQLQLSDGAAKLKAKLKSLLVPSFFASTSMIPNERRAQLSLLELDYESIKNLHPTELTNQFQKVQNITNDVLLVYPWHSLTLLSHFKLQFKNLVEEYEDNKSSMYNFHHPLISQELLKLKTQAIYPKNSDLFIEFKVNDSKELQLPLTSFNLKIQDDITLIVLKSHHKEVVNFHTTKSLAHFIKFILQSAMDVKIADILLNLKVPTSVELETALLKYEEMKTTYTSIQQETEKLISQLLRNEISKN